MSELCKFYLLRDVKDKSIDYYHPLTSFEAQAGEVLLNFGGEQKRLIVEREISVDEIPAVIRKINEMRKEQEKGTFYPTQEFKKAIDDIVGPDPKATLPGQIQ